MYEDQRQLERSPAATKTPFIFRSNVNRLNAVFVTNPELRSRLEVVSRRDPFGRFDRS